MTGRPAPGTALGVGTDLVAVPRLRAALDRRPALADRLFTAGERERCGRNADAVPGLAARFAAKEAVMKALGRGIDSMAFTDIEVVHDPGGAPDVVLSGRAAARAGELGVDRWLVSLTHDGDMAHAIAIACA